MEIPIGMGPSKVERRDEHGVRHPYAQRRDDRAGRRLTCLRVADGCEVRACRYVLIERHLILARASRNVTGSRHSARSNEAAIIGYDGPEDVCWVALVALRPLRPCGSNRASWSLRPGLSSWACRSGRARVPLRPLS